MGFYRSIDSATSTPIRAAVLDPFSTTSQGLWTDIKTVRWVVAPGIYFTALCIYFCEAHRYHPIASSLKLLLIPVILWVNWELLAPYVAKGVSNPFTPLLFISHPSPASSPDDPRYTKGPLDFVFIAYYIIFWSFVRQSITIYLSHPVARFYGMKKRTKLDRFGEQGYAMLYFAFTGFWGIVGSSLQYAALPWLNPD